MYNNRFQAVDHDTIKMFPMDLIPLTIPREISSSNHSNSSLPCLSRVNSEPSPSSSISSVQSLAGPHGDDHRSNSRRYSDGSMTSWEEGDDGDHPNTQPIYHISSAQKASRNMPEDPPPERQSSDFTSVWDRLSASKALQQSCFPPDDPESSPINVRDELTPRAEVPQPVWPMSCIVDKGRAGSLRALGIVNCNGECQKESISPGVEIKRKISVQRKQVSPNTAPDRDRGIHNTAALGQDDPSKSRVFPLDAALPIRSPSSKDVQSHSEGGLGTSQSVPADISPSTCSTPHQDSVPSTPCENPIPSSPSQQDVTMPKGHRLLACSPSTGCQITAPLSPPAHYPSTCSRRHKSPEDKQDGYSPQSSCSHSSIASLAFSEEFPLAPKWARPPAKRSTRTERARSSGSEGAESFRDISPDIDFDEDLFEGKEGDDIEVMKGADGRIAIKAESGYYKVLCWLPGFTLDNITISAKGERGIQIVADQWDDGDHVEWYVSLGQDANMRAISAKLDECQLTLQIARIPKPSRPFWSHRLRSFSLDNIGLDQLGLDDVPIGTMARAGTKYPTLARGRPQTRENS